MNATADETALRIASLHLHPVKSCGGLSVAQAWVGDTGFDLDRWWMVVDEDGEFVSQRELPRMALVRPQVRHGDIVLRAPGMLALHLQQDQAERALRVRVWDDEMPAYDMGDLAAQWFSDFLGRRLRLARFDPESHRLSSARWTGDVQARNAFTDGFPLLVLSTASLRELNRRLQAAGHGAVAMERFRPNIVIDGWDDPHAEDHVQTLTLESPDGEVVLRLAKPCGRCSIPDVDPETAQTGHAVTDALSAYRAEPRIGGALAFGQNAVVVSGTGCRLQPGARVRATLAF